MLLYKKTPVKVETIKAYIEEGLTIQDMCYREGKGYTHIYTIIKRNNLLTSRMRSNIIEKKKRKG